MVKKSFILWALLLFWNLGSPLPLAGSPLGEADLDLLKIATPVTTDVGRFVSYGLEVTNFGPDTAAGVVVTDALPMGMQFNGATEDICQENGGVVTCDLGDLDPGASQTVNIVVLVTLPGKIDNTAEVDALSPDPDPGNNRSTFSVVVVGSGGGGSGSTTTSCSLHRSRPSSPSPVWRPMNHLFRSTLSPRREP